LPHGGSVPRFQIEQARDLAMGNRQLQPDRLPAAELQEIDATFPGNVDRVLHKHRYGCLAAERSTVIHERHGDQIIPKEEALGVDKRQDAGDSPRGIAGGEIQALVVEYVLDDGLPAPTMEGRPAGAALNARVPLGLRSRE